MALANNVPFSSFRIQDASITVTATLPTANNTSVLNTNSIALFPQGPIGATGVVGGAFPVTTKFLVSLSATAANGANNKNVNIWLQHTTANSSNLPNTSAWANIQYLANPVLQLTDNNGAGSAATTINFLLPPDLIQNFIRAQYSGEANGGNAANGTLTMTLVF